MKYIEIEVRTALIVHGYDDENNEIEQEINEQEYMTKLVSIERIQSVSEKYLLVTASHERVMYWEYKGTLKEIKSRLERAGAIIA